MNKPIFIHSLYRSGSTYFFNVFRRSDAGYFCYQEPENGLLNALNGNPEELLKVGQHESKSLRHQLMNQPYFWEFYLIRSSLRGLFHKSFTFDNFFKPQELGMPLAERNYLQALIENAKGRPVLQFCLSSGRVGAMKTIFAGIHIHLWREPRSQWWSFKINEFFDSAVHRIYNANLLPKVLLDVRLRCGIVESDSECLEDNNYKLAHSLGSKKNYFAFYALWLYSFLQIEKYADVTINIDTMSASEAYRTDKIQELSHLEITGLDFSDCLLPIKLFLDDEKKFYKEIENEVHAIFLSHGYTNTQIETASEAALHAQNLASKNESELYAASLEARKIALRYLDELAKVHVSISWRITKPLRWAKHNIERGLSRCYWRFR